MSSSELLMHEGDEVEQVEPDAGAQVGERRAGVAQPREPVRAEAGEPRRGPRRSGEEVERVDDRGALPSATDGRSRSRTSASSRCSAVVALARASEATSRSAAMSAGPMRHRRAGEQPDELRAGLRRRARPAAR